MADADPFLWATNFYRRRQKNLARAAASTELDYEHLAKLNLTAAHHSAALWNEGYRAADRKVRQRERCGWLLTR